MKKIFISFIFLNSCASSILLKKDISENGKDNVKLNYCRENKAYAMMAPSIFIMDNYDIARITAGKCISIFVTAGKHVAKISMNTAAGINGSSIDFIAKSNEDVFIKSINEEISLSNKNEFDQYKSYQQIK